MMSSNFRDRRIRSLVGECFPKGYFGIFTYLNFLTFMEDEKSKTYVLSFMLDAVFLITESVALRPVSLFLSSYD